MKKITSLLAIAAVALTAALSFGSCSKNDDPAVEPEPEPEKVYPVDSVIAVLRYNYSEDAIKLLDLKYEVTDFNGQTETFTVTKPGLAEKVYKTADVNAKTNVKLFVTYKNNMNEVAKNDSVDITFASGLYGYASVNGKLLDINTDYAHITAIDGLQQKDMAEQYVKTVASYSPLTYSMYLGEKYKDGVTESWFNLHGN